MALAEPAAAMSEHARPDDCASADTPPVVGVALVTYNRLGFVQQALAALLQRADVPVEVVVWNNASTDGTAAWLQTVADPRVRVVNHPENVGCNAFELALRQLRGDWLVEMDDDVLELPEGFLSQMIAAFAACPDLGYLALDVVRDDRTNGAKPEEYAYREERHGASCLQFGPVGGWLAMTPRALYERLHFPLVEGARHFYEDGMYCERLAAIGYRAAILKGVRCYHAVGVYWNSFYQDYWRERHADNEAELRKMRLYVEQGVLIKDTARPFSLRKCLGDLRRFLGRLLAGSHKPSRGAGRPGRRRP